MKIRKKIILIFNLIEILNILIYFDIKYIIYEIIHYLSDYFFLIMYIILSKYMKKFIIYPMVKFEITFDGRARLMNKLYHCTQLFNKLTYRFEIKKKKVEERESTLTENESCLY